MTTNTQTYYCSNADWHMARTYSDVAMSYRNFEEVNHRWYVMPLIVLIGSGIGSIIHMHWIWLVGIIIFFPLFFISYQRQFTGIYQQLVDQYQFSAPTQQQIPYISLEREHLLCHFFRPDGSTSHNIKLDEIDGIAIRTLRYGHKRLKLPVLINKKAKSLGAVVIPEIYYDENYYVLWVYSKSKVMIRQSIAIPKQWFTDATFAHFLQMIEQKTEKRLQLDPSIKSEAVVHQYLRKYTPHLHL